MRFINELSKEELTKLSRELHQQIVANSELVCIIADSNKVDRNDTLELYMYLQEKYCKKQDFKTMDYKFTKLAGKIAKALLKRGAE